MLRVDAGMVSLRSHSGGKEYVMVREVPQLFKEVEPTIKEWRFIPLGHAIIGNPVCKAPNFYYCTPDRTWFFPTRFYPEDKWLTKDEIFIRVCKYEETRNV